MILNFQLFNSSSETVNMNFFIQNSPPTTYSAQIFNSRKKGKLPSYLTILVILITVFSYRFNK
jgi:hypothetical protein